MSDNSGIHQPITNEALAKRDTEALANVQTTFDQPTPPNYNIHGAPTIDSEDIGYITGARIWYYLEKALIVVYQEEKGPNI